MVKALASVMVSGTAFQESQVLSIQKNSVGYRVGVEVFKFMELFSNI